MEYQGDLCCRLFRRELKSGFPWEYHFQAAGFAVPNKESFRGQGFSWKKYEEKRIRGGWSDPILGLVFLRGSIEAQVRQEGGHAGNIEQSQNIYNYRIDRRSDFG